MKTFSLLISLFLSIFVFAQVGIETTNLNAQLDVHTNARATSQRKGIQVDVNSTSVDISQGTFSLDLTNSSLTAIGGTASKYGIFNNGSCARKADRYEGIH